MKFIRIIFLLILALGVASCGSSRRAQKQGADARERATLERMQKDLRRQESEPLRRLLAEAYSWEGAPYAWGGESKKGVDCSALTMKVFDNSLGIKLPRNSAKQAEACDSMGRAGLRPGDLVFFDTKGASDRGVADPCGGNARRQREAVDYGAAAV